jgi:hypothetical protein
VALAPYFDKALQSVTSLIAGHSGDAVRKKLEGQRVALAFDAKALQACDARAAIELTTDLLSRLYPALDLLAMGAECEKGLARLASIAREANPSIEIGRVLREGTALTLAYCDVAGGIDGDVLYLGANGWTATFSQQPVASGDTGNPFGAGAAACIAAANVFRAVFTAELKTPGRDVALTLNLRDLCMMHDVDPALTLALDQPIDVGETFLIGLGAIGHGAVWALERLPGLTGTLHLIDDEDYDGTNPQRYIFTAATVTGAKVDRSAQRLRKALPEASIHSHRKTWDKYLSERDNWKLDRVALGLDSAEDRRLVQAALPRVVLNAWTQPANLGVSRHDFLRTACVACLYAPASSVMNEDQIVAQNLRFPADDQSLREVRRLLVTRDSLSKAMIEQIERQVGVAAGSLKSFVSKPLIDLYQRAACGGIVLSMGGTLGATARDAEIPMAFQSALAGILLALEVICDAGPLRPNPLPVRSEINLLKPIKGTLNSPAQRVAKCICTDDDYAAAFRAKYGVA